MDIQEKHPFYNINNRGICAGATVRRIINELPTTNPDLFDVVIIVCMLNDAWGGQTSAFSEPGSLGADIAELCCRLGLFKRSILTLGGSAPLWNLDLGWDVRVRRFVLMARSLGAPTTDGTQYFAELTRPEGS